MNVMDVLYRAQGFNSLMKLSLSLEALVLMLQREQFVAGVMGVFHNPVISNITLCGTGN